MLHISFKLGSFTGLLFFVEAMASTTNRRGTQREATPLGELSEGAGTVANESSDCRRSTLGPTSGQGHEGRHPIPAIVQTFWRRQVSATVAHDACRDHLGM